MQPCARRVTGRRGSIAERDSVARTLRNAYVEGDVSVETFIDRVDLLYAARTRADMRSLVADLSPRGAIGRASINGAERLSEFVDRFLAATRGPRPRALILPTRQIAVIGRSRNCDCVLADPSVSRRHALLRFRNGQWRLCDLGSLNGTYVNGCRAIDEVVVRPGDAVAFGCDWFRLVAPSNRCNVHSVAV